MNFLRLHGSCPENIGDQQITTSETLEEVYPLVLQWLGDDVNFTTIGRGQNSITGAGIANTKMAVAAKGNRVCVFTFYINQ